MCSCGFGSSQSLCRPYETRDRLASLPYARCPTFASIQTAARRCASAPVLSPWGFAMLDLVYIGLGLAFFAGCAWYVFVTERL